MKNQLQMHLYKGNHGGRRPNSGRKRIHSRGVVHRKREKITAHTPFHINFKYRLLIRTEKFRRIFETALENAQRYDFIVTHFTIQTNHIHIIGEAKSNSDLTKAMRSLTITLAKLFGKGSIQTERYHLHILRTPTECERAIRYVLLNDLKHGQERKANYTATLRPGRSWLLRKSSTP